MANAFAARFRYDVDANQELIALGWANVGGALFRGYPVTGGFSRTAVNADAGAKTPMASIVTASAVAFTLLFLTPLFYYLPKTVLAAIIFSAVFGLIDVRHAVHLWKIKRDDFAMLVVTFVATLTVGIGAGIGLGVGASLLWLIVKTTRPHTAVLRAFARDDELPQRGQSPERDPGRWGADSTDGCPVLLRQCVFPQRTSARFGRRSKRPESCDPRLLGYQPAR